LIIQSEMQLPAVIDSLLSTISDLYDAISFLYRVYFSKKVTKFFQISSIFL